jgi:hypothetical protein
MSIFVEWLARREIAEAREYEQKVKLVQKQGGTIAAIDQSDATSVIYFTRSQTENGNSYNISFETNYGKTGEKMEGDLVKMSKFVLGAVSLFLNHYRPAQLDWSNIKKRLDQRLLNPYAGAQQRAQVGADTLIQNAVAHANRNFPPDQQYRVSGNVILNRAAAQQGQQANLNFVPVMQANQKGYNQNLDKSRASAQKFRQDRLGNRQAANNWFNGL